MQLDYTAMKWRLSKQTTQNYMDRFWYLAKYSKDFRVCMFQYSCMFAF